MKKGGMNFLRAKLRAAKNFSAVKKAIVPVKKIRKGVREKTEVPVKIWRKYTRENKFLGREKFRKLCP